eukprot:GHVQ01034803.1.p1 GENE.GHVQ01034803.1~~GHVQ01034803.1.p1  ORF type:complete len:104 (+),score=10.31 GHVQ01034803.1:349-660(+)
MHSHKHSYELHTAPSGHIQRRSCMCELYVVYVVCVVVYREVYVTVDTTYTVLLCAYTSIRVYHKKLLCHLFSARLAPSAMWTANDPGQKAGNLNWGVNAAFLG